MIISIHHEIISLVLTREKTIWATWTDSPLVESVVPFGYDQRPKKRITIVNDLNLSSEVAERFGNDEFIFVKELSLSLREGEVEIHFRKW